MEGKGGRSAGMNATKNAAAASPAAKTSGRRVPRGQRSPYQDVTRLTLVGNVHQRGDTESRAESGGTN
jgi:hypothetical protein